MAASLFSQHSSNPLEVASSDPRNKQLLSEYRRAQEKRRDDAMASSDDQLAAPGEIEGYQTERRGQLVANGLVDLDESEDELMGGDDDEGEAQVAQQDENADDQYSDTHSSTDDERSILLKPREEREEIEEEIADLADAVPMLGDDYRIIDRLGTGTFSSVYKAVDLGYHSKWDNSPWHGHHPSSSSAYYQTIRKPEGSKVFVAVKRIYVTSNPERIRNEIQIMEDCRGCRHVSQLITAFRHEDQVVAIMPYHRNDDFRVSASS